MPNTLTPLHHDWHWRTQTRTLHPLNGQPLWEARLQISTSGQTWTTLNQPVTSHASRQDAIHQLESTYYTANETDWQTEEEHHPPTITYKERTPQEEEALIQRIEQKIQQHLTNNYSTWRH